MTEETWSIAEAKAKFSELVERVEKDGPQIITRNGRKKAVLMSHDAWATRQRRKGNLAEFFAASPLRGSGVKFERLKGRIRAPKL